MALCFTEGSPEEGKRSVETDSAPQPKLFSSITQAASQYYFPLWSQNSANKLHKLHPCSHPARWKERGGVADCPFPEAMSFSPVVLLTRNSSHLPKPIPRKWDGISMTHWGCLIIWMNGCRGINHGVPTTETTKIILSHLHVPVHCVRTKVRLEFNHYKEGGVSVCHLFPKVLLKLLYTFT